MPTPIRRAFVKAPFQFELRDDAPAALGPEDLRIDVAACSVCGTDIHIADRMAKNWEPFGHEVAGVVTEVGPAVRNFKPGDRVALDSSAPCGLCEACREGSPLECRGARTYWGGTMGFADQLVAPQQVAFHAGDLDPDVACLLEPLGVSIDMVDVADVGPGDRVLIIGPGPLGLLAIPPALERGAARVWLAGRSHSVARLAAGKALGATVIETDLTPLRTYDFGPTGVNKILVVAPPDALNDAFAVGCKGSIISFIGIAFGPEATIPFDADAFHFKRQQLRASMASPGTRGPESLRLLRSGRFNPRLVICHRFELADIAAAMTRNRDDKATIKKQVMLNRANSWVQEAGL